MGPQLSHLLPNHFPPGLVYGFLCPLRVLVDLDGLHALTHSVHHAGLSCVGLHRDDVLEAVQDHNAVAAAPHLQDLLHLGGDSIDRQTIAMLGQSQCVGRGPPTFGLLPMSARRSCRSPSARRICMAL